MRKLIPRWTHRLYAFTAGYFWTPCPLCGNNFGGHEWIHDGRHDLPTSLNTGRATCPNCIVGNA